MPQVSEPEWLKRMLDLRIELMMHEFGGRMPPALRQAGFAMTTLTEPAETATREERDQWERTCDHCGRYFGDDDPFYTGISQREIEGVQLNIAFGCCAECAAL